MNIYSKLAAACSLALVASTAQAAAIGVGDFTSPTIVGFGNPGNGVANVATPLVIGPVSITDPDAATVWWWGADNAYNDCVGGCVTTSHFTPGTLKFTLADEVAMAGFYVGQATAFSLTVSFFDAGDNLLGSVIAAGAGDGVAFAGWQSLGAGIKSVTVANVVPNSFVTATRSAYLQAAVPEPASWALMIAGFALVGAGLRGRRTAVRFA
ncbi:MAG: PEPxxWA-CTERM sorting domain-containing protein [Sphingobium sp.]|nr:PEPxxWA-CTERM sorting domain-containing protein [Sphingobium sp.]